MDIFWCIETQRCFSIPWMSHDDHLVKSSASNPENDKNWTVLFFKPNISVTSDFLC